MFLSRAAALGAVVFLAACQSGTSVQLARPKPPTPGASQQALTGTGYAGTATFSAPLVDPATWSGSPIGSGTWSAQSTPPRSGGNQSIAADDFSDPTQAVHYVMVGGLSSGSSSFFGIVSLTSFAVGTRLVDNVSTFAGIFDSATGNPIALATGGTLVITAAGATITGSFNGTLEDVQGTPPPGCRSNADCAAGEVCSAGQCVTAPNPPACTTSAQCAAGQVCTNGQCVTSTPPGCTSSAQCAAGQVCSNGQCVTSTPPPTCQTNADCSVREVCSAGQCVPAPVAGSCTGQGTGAYSGSAGSTATCSALGTGALSLTNGIAGFGEDENGQLALFVFDPGAGSNGLVLPLSACPAAAGAVSVSPVQLYSQVNAGPGVTLVAIREGSGTVTFTSVGARYTGTFSVTLTGGGSLTGSFDVQ